MTSAEDSVTIYELAREAEAAKLRIECVASDLLALAEVLEHRKSYDAWRIDWVADELRRKAEELAG
jgi:hypothetical protein